MNIKKISLGLALLMCAQAPFASDTPLDAPQENAPQENAPQPSSTETPEKKTFMGTMTNEIKKSVNTMDKTKIANTVKNSSVTTAVTNKIKSKFNLSK